MTKESRRIYCSRCAFFGSEDACGAGWCHFYDRQTECSHTGCAYFREMGKNKIIW